MTQEIGVNARHVRGRPWEGILVSCYHFGNLVLRLGTCQARTSWPRSPSPTLLLWARVVSPGRSRRGWPILSLCFEVVLVASLDLFFIRLDGDHCPFKGRQLHLHMPRGGYCSNPVQSRPAQKYVISWWSINNKVPDVSSAGSRAISGGRPQLYVSPHFSLVSREAIQTTIVRPQLVRRQVPFVEGRPEHHVGRTSLVHEDAVYLSSHSYYRDHQRVIVLWNHILQVGLSEDEVKLGCLVWLLGLYCHHSPGVSPTLGCGAHSSWESSRDCVDLPVDRHLVPLVSCWGRWHRSPLWFL